MEVVHCFVLSYIKYKDNDAILRGYSLENGFESYYLRGIYAPKNKKKAYLSPLNPLKLTIHHAHQHQLPIVKSIELLYPEIELPEFRTASVLFFVADFLCQILPNETQNPILFRLIEQFYLNCCQRNFQSHLIFLILYLQNHGLAPAISEGNFLNPETGCFSSVQNKNDFPAIISSFWKAILSEDNAYSVTISPQYRRIFLESILFYYQLHYPDFAIPKSLDIVYETLE